MSTKKKEIFLSTHKKNISITTIEYLSKDTVVSQHYYIDTLMNHIGD